MSVNLPKKLPRFHATHGNDIKIYDGWTTARRTETKSNGIVFTSTSIKPNEKIYIEFVKVSDKLPGIISIGFTSYDPSNLRFDLPKSTRSVLKRKPGFWMCSLSKEFCIKKKMLFFYVTDSGEIRFGTDEVEIGQFDKNVNVSGQLWALVEIWSPPTTVKIVKTELVNPSQILHQACGRNVKLTPNTIQKVNPKLNFNYAFTSRPLKLNEEIVVKMMSRGNLILGVTSCNPYNLSPISLPENPDLLIDRPEYWVVINDPTWKFEKNDELSYLLTDRGEMKIWKNSSLLLKVVHVDHTLKLWGFFSLGLEGVEVTVSKPKSLVPSAPLEEPEDTATKIEPTRRKQNTDGSECLVCYENAVEAALYPCGHMCMCLICARKQWRGNGEGLCPICRMKIKDVLKIYKT